MEVEKQLLKTGLGTEFEEDLNMTLSKDDASTDNSEKAAKESVLSEQVDIKSNEYSTDDEGGAECVESYNDASEESDDELSEDIYGRRKDKKGNIVHNKYVPPAARIASAGISVDDEKARKLKKQCKGILNKLAMQNMHTIANQVI